MTIVSIATIIAWISGDKDMFEDAKHHEPEYTIEDEGVSKPSLKQIN